MIEKTQGSGGLADIMSNVIKKQYEIIDKVNELDKKLNSPLVMNIFNHPIYTITTIEVDKKDGFSSSRCVGFYYDLNEAKNAIEENRCDLFETCYLYAVIEESYEGIYPHIEKQLWYKYNLKKEKYEKCKKPEFAMGYGSCGIG